MANDKNRPAVNQVESDVGDSGDEQATEAYLNRLCAQLKTVVPSRREEIRREVYQHLQMLIARQNNVPDAVQNALTQFGDPETVGRNMARQARYDSIRLSWRAVRWPTRLSLFWLLLVGFWGAAVTIEFCRQMQWGGDLWQLIVIGPLMPLLWGFWWGTRVFPTRRGYLFIGFLALVLAVILPIPGQFAHANMDAAGMMDLSGCVRFTFVCYGCGMLALPAGWRVS